MHRVLTLFPRLRPSQFVFIIASLVCTLQSPAQTAPPANLPEFQTAYPVSIPVYNGVEQLLVLSDRWLVVVTSSAAWAKLFDPVPRIGFLAHMADLKAKATAGALPPEMLQQLPRLLFNDQVNTALTALFLTLTWILVLDTARVCYRAQRGLGTPPFTEAPYVRTQLAG